MPASRSLFAVSFVFALLLAAPAAADVIPGDVEACTGLSSRAACTSGGTTGFCNPATCTRLEYGDGAVPSSMEYSCLRCVPGSAPAVGGCTAQVGQSGSAALAFLVLAIAAIGLARKKR